MSRVIEKLTGTGVTPPIEAAGTGNERRVVDPELRSGRGEVLAPRTISLSNGFEIASIQDDPNLPLFGTFTVQNKLTVSAQCKWEASHLHTIQRAADLPDQTTFGSLGGAVEPPIPLAGGGGEVNTASNLGGGDGVFASKVGADLQFKSLTAGANITLTPNANEIQIAAAGGGGGADIRANRIVIGNQLAGDTANTCDVLDAGDGVNLKATIEAATSQDIFVKQGVYTCAGALFPITVPTGVNVEGAGEDTEIVATERFDAFSLDTESRLANLKIRFEYQGVPTLGTYGVELSDRSVVQNVNFITGVLPAGDQTSLLGVIGTGGSNNGQVLDCRVNCDFQKASNPLGNGGVSAVAGAFSGSIIRVNVAACDRGISIGGSNNHIELVGTMAEIGDLQGSGQCLFMNARMSDPLLTSSTALQLNGLSTSEIIGSLLYDDGEGPVGIRLVTSGSAPSHNRISCSISNFSTAVSIDDGATDTKIVGCSIISTSDGVNVINLFSATRTTIQGCTIQGANANGIQTAGAAVNRTLITGNAINMSGGASIGISFLGGTTNAVPVGNSIEASTQIDDSSGDVATIAAVAAAAALNV